MGIIERFSRKGRVWQRCVFNCQEAISQAAFVQARLYGIVDPTSEAQHISNQYAIAHKQKNWRDYGDIAFHLIAVWPPDLAYVILYSLRDIQPSIGYDPVPLILKAVESIYFFRPQTVKLHLHMTQDIQNLFESPQERADKGSRIIIREISMTSLSWASSIYSSLDPKVKPFIKKQLIEFNPKGADILFKSKYVWLFTFEGFAWMFKRVLFGKEL